MKTNRFVCVCLYVCWGDRCVRWKRERSNIYICFMNRSTRDWTLDHDIFLHLSCLFFVLCVSVCKLASVSATLDAIDRIKKTLYTIEYEGYWWSTVANSTFNMSLNACPSCFRKGRKTPQTQPGGVLNLWANVYSQKTRQSDVKGSGRECRDKDGVNCQVPWGKRGQCSQLFLFFLFLEPGVPLWRVSCAKKINTHKKGIIMI